MNDRHQHHSARRGPRHEAAAAAAILDHPLSPDAPGTAEDVNAATAPSAWVPVLMLAADRATRYPS